MKQAFASTIVFKSNIYPTNGSPLSDRAFLSQIHMPEALVELDKKIKFRQTDYRLTSIQKEEFDHASLHCTYAPQNDYPWGTINENGYKRISCKCTNIGCFMFDSCRKFGIPFDESELIYLHENLKSTASNADVVILQQPVYPTISDNINPVNSQPAKPSPVNDNLINDSTHIPDIETDIKPDLVEIRGQVKKSGSEEDQFRFNKNLNTELDVFRGIGEITEDVNNNLENEAHSNKHTDADGQIGFDSFINESQEDVISRRKVERQIINAGPGTGKTWTLIKRLIYLVNEENVEPENILVLCFSRAAVDVIRKRLENAISSEECSLNIQSIEIKTFDSFATKLLGHIIRDEPEKFQKGFTLSIWDYDTRIMKATEMLAERSYLLECCEHLVVDEVQDLVSVRARFVLQLLDSLSVESGFTLLGDACQSVYDWQVKDSHDINSVEFYRILFDKYSLSRFIEFGYNHRQNPELDIICSFYRTSILTGTEDERKEALDFIKENTTDITELKLDSITASQINSIGGSGSLGILCRTNNQVLRISTWFRNADIPHSLQRTLRSSGNGFLAKWIGRFFYSYEHETVGYEIFVSRFVHIFPNASLELVEQCWNGLLDAQQEVKIRYNVAEMLTSVRNYAKASILFSVETPEEDIVISTIHKAKGKEFEKVIVPLDLLQSQSKTSLSEHKVTYVAITRPKDQILVSVIKDQYCPKDRRISRQWNVFNTGSNRRSRIGAIELGAGNDVDLPSQAQTTEQQEFIQNSVKKGNRLKLIKRFTSNANVAYDIFIDDDATTICLGSASKSFMDDYEYILRKNYKQWNYEIPATMYSSQIVDVYVDEISTVISPVISGKPGARQYDQVCIWNCFSIVGLGHLENDRY